ncbi:hypothetical protein LINPERHAP2_LOCUS41818 [Linum perenne]
MDENAERRTILKQKRRKLKIAI